MAGSPLRTRRFVLLVVLLCGFGVVLFRLVSLQVLQAAELTVKADRQHQKTVSLEGARGTIVDRHGKLLALNMDVPSVFGVGINMDDKTAQRIVDSISNIMAFQNDDNGVQATWFYCFGTLLEFIPFRTFSLKQDIDIGCIFGEMDANRLIQGFENLGYKESGMLVEDIGKKPINIKFNGEKGIPP